MKNKKIAAVAGISVFFLLSVLLIFWYGTSLHHLLDLPLFIFVAGGGAVLALAKSPRGAEDFFNYFSRTALLSGAIATVLGTVAMLRTLSDAASVAPFMQMVLNAMLYGLALSAVSYVLSGNKTN